MRVINMSARTLDPAGVSFINGQVNLKPNLTFVKSAGNNGAAGTITNPGLAQNIITVGAVNRDFTRRADFSSYGAAAATPMKPDIVAPGEYVNAPLSRDINGDSMVNDFGRGFLADDYKYFTGPTYGDISGTSFAAPHVAGAAALLHEYQMAHAATHEADHRVIKAVLLNGATTNVKRHGGAPWSQATTGTMPGLVVTRSLDEELGAGMLDCLQSLKNYIPPEIHAPDTNTLANFNIPASAAGAYFWDLEQVVSGGGMVNYLLGGVTGAPLRATLTWDFIVGGGGLQPLELRLFEEGTDPGNPAGFDPMDLLLARTALIGENVKLFDFPFGVPDFNGSNNYFLQVINSGTANATYGLAVIVPEPTAGLCFLMLVGFASILRSRT